ncbi:MAG: hypothetical protein IPJ65_16650 [Archangiaceae bacterium]|nr:hypothetical protein [Archangiaceae bacterium]
MRTLMLALLSVVVSSCLISSDHFGQRSCHQDSECPQIAGYSCVSGTRWPQKPCGEDEAECVCEVIFPPQAGGIGYDGGGPLIPDAGPPPDYCSEIRPLLDKYCLGTCHGAQMGFPNVPYDFRLDYWEPGPNQLLADGGAGLPGVKARLDRIDARIFLDRSNLMPPPPDMYPIQPTEADRALVHKWITKFDAVILDGGCLPTEGLVAMKNDGGMDAGSVDAGAPVSFATDVLPIFTGGNCNCHTGANTSGTLSLTAANAYNNLVNVNTSMGCNNGMAKRVVANSPQTSMLWLKASNDPNKCNNFMPRGAAMPLSQMNAAQFDTITRWIRQGARNN